MNEDTSKIDEWDLSQCRDYLADIRGYTWKPLNDTAYQPDTGMWYDKTGLHLVTDHWIGKHGMYHPIEATLDESSKLPEGWVLRSYVTYLCHCEAIAEYFPKFDEAPSMQITASTSTKTDERLVRFRLRCKVESLTVRAEGEVTK